ncbi:MAG: hypothetical protein ACK551_08200 [Vampirovibrionales bacterium]
MMILTPSYASPLGTPALPTSPAIQSKANARQRVGGAPKIPLNRLESDFQKALRAYDSRKPLKDGGKRSENTQLLENAIRLLKQLLDHPELPDNEERKSLQLLLDRLIEKQSKYKRRLKSRRPRSKRSLGRFLSGKLSLLSKKLSLLSNRFWYLLEKSLY